ncbi:MAG: sirohydrochlorin cobaltochelatase [Lachnospiraceae bacterium]|jgi:sirohydrochlorin cobaltochelatase|nr:sirohydrochlorin cobaltochelatase [Lachnospiraceae bacterium]
MKKQGSLLLAIALAAGVCLSGCKGSQEAEARTAITEAAKTEVVMSETDRESQTEEETSAEKMNPSSDTVLLAVSFGTSYNDSRDITIGAVEKAIADAFPQYEIRRVFTAQIIIDKLKERDGLEIDNMTQALERALADGIKNLIVQPTHLMDGYEYNDVLKELEEYRESFDQVVVGKPLLDSDEDFETVAQALVETIKDRDDGETAIVFMGHGTEAESNQVYERLQRTLTESGFENYYIGTVEAKPDLLEILAALKEAGSYKKVILRPLMLVAGDHANNDMAGEEEDSWKSVLESEGYQVECQIHGLGELEAIRELYVDHAKAAAELLK